SSLSVSAYILPSSNHHGLVHHEPGFMKRCLHLCKASDKNATGCNGVGVKSMGAIVEVIYRDCVDMNTNPTRNPRMSARVRMSSDWVLIFGTTIYCVVAVWQSIPSFEIIENDQGNRTTPSYVAFNDAERLVGDAANNQAAYNPTNTNLCNCLSLDKRLVVDEELFEDKATGGDTHLGGEDFDNRMVKHFVREFKRKHKEDISNNLKALGRLRALCERAKRTISTYFETTLDIDCLYNGIDFSFFSQAKCYLVHKFEEFNNDMLFMETVPKLIPKVTKIQKLLQELFNGKLLCQQLNPDEAVAAGAGILAANLSGQGDEAVRSLDIIDVTPLSLGLKCKGDVMAVLIPRNSPIPTKKEDTFCTAYDGQTAVSVRVYQGERSKSNENYLLGEVRLSGIPSAPRHNAIKITNTSSLSEVEIEKMIEDAKRYKQDDEAHMKKTKARNALETYACKLRAKMKEYKVRLKLRNIGVSVKGLEDIEHQIEETIEWLDENPYAEMVEYEDKKAKLAMFKFLLKNHGSYYN
ncbi:putative mediator of RNA polymerase II transcription subunit 37c, partial [Tanacetum coccineum]